MSFAMSFALPFAMPLALFFNTDNLISVNTFVNENSNEMS